MKPQKPFVTAEPDATFATVKWEPVQQAYYYTVKYTLKGSTTVIDTFHSTSCSTLLTSLQPDTEYTVFVNTVIFTQTSQDTVVNFKTKSITFMVNLGSGSELFAHDLDDKFNLEQTPIGYKFNKENPSMYIQEQFFQFCTFDVGQIKNRSNLTLQLQGTSGVWTTSMSPGHLENTIILIKIDGHTEWLDANKLRIPGVHDTSNGARVFDKKVDGWHTFRITLSCMNLSTPYEGSCFVKLGITEGNRSISGITFFS